MLAGLASLRPSEPRQGRERREPLAVSRLLLADPGGSSPALSEISFYLGGDGAEPWQERI